MTSTAVWRWDILQLHKKLSMWHLCLTIPGNLIIINQSKHLFFSMKKKSSVALKWKTQQQIKKHNGKSENTVASQKTQQQNRKHNGNSENTMTLQFFFLIAMMQQSTQSPHFFKTVNAQLRLKQWHSWSKWHILFAKGCNCAKTFRICNKGKFCLQTTQLANKCMSSSNQSLHSGKQNTKYSTQCKSVHHCFSLQPIIVCSFHASAICCQICLLAKNWIQNQICFDANFIDSIDFDWFDLIDCFQTVVENSNTVIITQNTCKPK